MSNEELQNIIGEAVRARAHNVEVSTQRAYNAAEPQPEETITPALEIPEAQNLGEEAIDDIISQWTDSTTQDSDAQEDAEMEQAYVENGIMPEEPPVPEIRPFPLPVPELIDQLWEESVAQAEPEEEQEEEQADSSDPREATIPLELDNAHQRASTSRFSGAEWFDIVQDIEITLAGLGGIGSWAALLLSRLHPRRMFLYDPDTVETVNLSGQLYSINQIGHSKVVATQSNLDMYSNYFNIVSMPQRFGDTGSMPSDIMISGFDNMEARKTYYGYWKRYIELLTPEDRNKCLYVDARMSAEDIQILCITGTDEAYMKEYEEKWLFSDEEADSTLCSYKQTSYCAAIIGGLITNLVVNFCTNLGTPIIERPLPFLTTYNASTMFLNVRS